jgi:hypothetical protein
MNYIDYKVIQWKRIYYSDEIDLEKKLSILKENGDIEDILDIQDYDSIEDLEVTEIPMTPIENGRQPTVEVYKDDKLIWDNEGY